MTEKAPLYTIGHSNHSEEYFIVLLRQHKIDVLADVRSQPFSKYTPHFNRESLQVAVRGFGIRYLFIGDQFPYVNGDTLIFVIVSNNKGGAQRHADF